PQVRLEHPAADAVGVREAEDLQVVAPVVQAGGQVGLAVHVNVERARQQGGEVRGQPRDRVALARVAVERGHALNPPSTGSTTPLRWLARSLSKKEATAPTSAPVPALRSGVAAIRASTPPGMASLV